MNEALVKLEGDTKDNLLCAWSMQSIEAISYSACETSGRSDKFEKDGFPLRNRECGGDAGGVHGVLGGAGAGRELESCGWNGDHSCKA